MSCDTCNILCAFNIHKKIVWCFIEVQSSSWFLKTRTWTCRFRCSAVVPHRNATTLAWNVLKSPRFALAVWFSFPCSPSSRLRPPLLLPHPSAEAWGLEASPISKCDPVHQQTNEQRGDGGEMEWRGTGIHADYRWRDWNVNEAGPAVGCVWSLWALIHSWMPTWKAASTWRIYSWNSHTCVSEMLMDGVKSIFMTQKN